MLSMRNRGFCSTFSEKCSTMGRIFTCIFLISSALVVCEIQFMILCMEFEKNLWHSLIFHFFTKQTVRLCMIPIECCNERLSVQNCQKRLDWRTIFKSFLNEVVEILCLRKEKSGFSISCFLKVNVKILDCKPEWTLFTPNFFCVNYSAIY